MKKVLGVSLIAVMILGASGAALAWWGGPAMGMGYGPQGGGGGWGPGAMMGPRGGWGRGGGGPGFGPCWSQGTTGATATAIDENKAKEIANEYAAKNLPGYTVEKLVKFERPRGNMYQVELKGPNNEVRYLHINPFGNVIPFGVGRAL
jgi:hypothetical protein